MFKEFEKYNTGQKTAVVCTVINATPKHDITLMEDEYNIPAGDLIGDFIKHRSKPKRKRDFNHDLVDKQYVKILNKIGSVKKNIF